MRLELTKPFRTLHGFQPCSSSSRIGSTLTESRGLEPHAFQRTLLSRQVQRLAALLSKKEPIKSRSFDLPHSLSLQDCSFPHPKHPSESLLLSPLSGTPFQQLYLRLLWEIPRHLVHFDPWLHVVLLERIPRVELGPLPWQGSMRPLTPYPQIAREGNRTLLDMDRQSTGLARCLHGQIAGPGAAPGISRV